MPRFAALALLLFAACPDNRMPCRESTVDFSVCICGEHEDGRVQECNAALRVGGGCCASQTYPTSGECSCGAWQTACYKDASGCTCAASLYKRSFGTVADCTPETGQTCCKSENKCVCSTAACTGGAAALAKCTTAETVSICPDGGKSVADCRSPTTISTGATTGATGTTNGCSATLNVTGKYASKEQNANTQAIHDAPVNLYQSDTSVTGWYLGTGGAVGTFNGTLAGCIVTGTWQQESAPPGPFSFTFIGGGESFSGGWDYQGGTPKWTWTGTRTSTSPDAKPSTSGSGCHANVDCGSCQYCELSTGNCRTKLSCR